MPKLLPAFVHAIFKRLKSKKKKKDIIQSLSLSSKSVEQWSKLEIAITVDAVFENPYDYNEIALQGRFTSPNGTTKTVDGFYMEEFEITNLSSGVINALNTGKFFIRFAPDMIGHWELEISLQNTFSKIDSFECIAVTDDLNHGFVQSSNSNYLQFSDGKPFIPIGENMAWALGNPIVDYQKWLDQFQTNGGNFFRLWQCHWGLGLEWHGLDYHGLLNYHQKNAFYTDWLLDYCAEKGIQVSYCLQHHGQVATEVNPNWQDNPYNKANGGPCKNPKNFFINPKALQYTQNRFRYVIARWGYSRAIATWELFNEADWMDGYEKHQKKVANWHIDMAAFLKEKDPNQHLISSSFARKKYDPQIWSCPDIDYTQTHFYQNTSNLERVLVDNAQEYLKAYQKPVLVAEFGLSIGGNDLDDLDTQGIHLHNCMWATLFSGSMGAGLSWWWDSYIEPQNLYHHFAPLARVVETIDWVTEQFEPLSVKIDAPPSDLLAIPDQSWGGETDALVQVNSSGVVYPNGLGLGKYLYGKSFNTESRNPPTFELTTEKATVFRMKTGDSGTDEVVIKIWLNGDLVLQEEGQINQEYAIQIPAGQHTIKIENTGEDWVSVVSYRFENLGKLVDAYVLRNKNESKLAAYLLNKNYNHQSLQNGTLPAKVSFTNVLIHSMTPGAYNVQYFDCQTNEIIGSLRLETLGIGLEIPVPPFLWDIHFQVLPADDLPTEAEV